MKITAILNLKGGVAKTATAANMGAVLARDYGKRVLLVDADSQCNLSEFFGAVEDGQMGSLVDVLKVGNYANPEQLICTTGHKGLDILPGAKELMALDLSMLSGGKIDYNAIKQFLAKVADFYDYCFIDCPPAFNAAGAAALVAADDVLIPVKLDAFSLQGMGNLMEQVRNMQRINPALKVAGLLPTMYYPNEDAVKAREMLTASDFRVFPSIRRSDKVDGMTYAQEPLCVYSPKSAAAVDYRRLVKAYVERELTGVVLEYSDGTVERPEKCACFQFEPTEDDMISAVSSMLNMSGRDLANLVWAVMGLGERMGLFADNEEGER